jgi:sigma-E factor negative regulatory protein RseC
MIVETGRVIKIEKGKAIVEVGRQSADCGKCQAECAHKPGKGVMQVEANDPIGVQVNQYVQISIHSASALRALFVVYMIPLFALVVGALFGGYLGTRLGIRNVLEILGSFSFLGLSLIIVRLYNNRFKQDIHNQPVITKVI